MLIENYSTAAAPQVEVNITPADVQADVVAPQVEVDITPANVQADVVAPQVEVDEEIEQFLMDITPANVQADVTAPQVEVDINAANVQVPTQALDLTVDFWCICKLPDDGRSYIQCSREDKCHGATDGWFHPECLDNAGWPKPRRTQKNWVCEGCDIHDNGV